MTETASTLKNIDMFNALNREDFQALVNATHRLEIPTNGMIATEGEKGEECYFILNGIVQIFTTSVGGEIALAKVTKGGVIGEQSLLPCGTGKRNASIRAFTDVSLLVIPKAHFLKALARNSSLEQKLLDRGQNQIRFKLRKQTILFNSLSLEKISFESYRSEYFNDGDIIFSQGDSGDKVYMIVSGKVDIYKEQKDNRNLLVQLEAGGVFGELALLWRKPRSASAVAQGRLKVISIDKTAFLTLYQQSPEVREYLQALKKIYPMGGIGFATQHSGKFMDKDCLTTVCTLSKGISIVSSLVIGEEIFNLNLVGIEKSNSEIIQFKDKTTGIERELTLSNSKISSVLSQGFWPELGAIYHMVQEQTPLSEQQKSFFCRKGLLRQTITTPTQYKDKDIICSCIQVTYNQICQRVNKGDTHINKLMDSTGAGSVCGSCIPVLKAIQGSDEWTLMRIAEVIPISDNIFSFRIKPKNDTKLKPAKPGQHLLIQARIADQWVQRPYTISSSAKETEFYEITVKREPHGVFSRWLFNQTHDDTIVRITEPKGDYFADLTSDKPIVCLVGGIGLTPALAICRSLAHENTRQRLHIDYSVSTSDQMVYKEELQSVQIMDNITVNLRATSETGRLNSENIEQLTNNFPDADFFICGPPSYERNIINYLRNSTIPDKNIHVEQFTHVGGKPANQSKDYFYLGLFLLLAFVAQDLFQIKWPWLETLQKIENYRIGSGLFLGSYLLAQFLLPLARWRGNFKAATRHYRLHKLQGAFAPVFFYVHTTQISSYAYLWLLTIFYFTNFFMGLINPERVKNSAYKKQYTYYWILIHVMLSVAILALVFFHAYVAFSY